MNKKLLITILVAVSVLVIGSVLAVVGYFNGGRDYFQEHSGYQEVADADLIGGGDENLAAFAKVSYTADYGDLTVVPGDHYGIALKNYTKETLPVFRVEGDTLYVENPEGESTIHVSLNFGDNAPETVITVPQGADLTELGLTTDDGDIFIQGLNVPTLKINSSYGDVELENMTITTATLEVEDGEVDIEGMEGEALSVIGDYGDIDLGETKVNDMKVEVNDGDIEIQGVTAAAFSLKSAYGSVAMKNSVITNGQVTVKDGDFSATASQWNGGSLESSYGNIAMAGALLGVITVTAEDGDILLDITGKEADYAYSLTDDYGDITLNGKAYQGTVISKGDLPNNITATAENGDIEVNFK